MGWKVLVGIVIIFAIMLGGWWFFWPLIECSYAITWEPLISNSHKFTLFIIGGLIFWGAVISGIKLVVL